MEIRNGSCSLAVQIQTKQIKHINKHLTLTVMTFETIIAAAQVLSFGIALSFGAAIVYVRTAERRKAL